ncbi:UBN2_2 domain-containing protein, partial [Cephalotus follicularis]
ILLHIQEMYGAESRTQRFNLSRKLFKAQMQEGALVHEHGLKMIEMIEQLAQLGFVMDHDLYVDLILTSLPKSFSQFLVNFHMNKIEVTLSELVAMMRTVEADFDSGKSKTHSLLLPSSRSTQGKGSASSSCKGKGVLMPVNTKGKGACFQWGKTGHWKKDCRVAVAAVSTDNPHGASTSDTRCGTNLCNSLQGLRKVRNLGAGELDLRLGDGSRIIAQAVGVYDISLCNNFILTLDPCYYV